MHKFEKKVLDTIKKYNLLIDNQKVVVGVSGGKDSMALLCSLTSLGYQCVAVHINHMLRGCDAEDDQKFVEDFCKQNSIEFFSRKIDVLKISKNEKISVETAGRNARYSYFNEIAQKFNVSKIAVAHNKSDSVETIIFNLIRGSSALGLKGIKIKNNNIVRPIIEMKNDEILEYLEYKNINFRVDKTNFDTDYTRNKIRNKIIPLMEQINENVIDTIYSNSKIIDEENDLIESIVKKNIDIYVKSNENKVFLDTKDFDKLHSVIKARLVIYCIKNAVKEHIEVSKKHIEAICNLSQGKMFRLGNIGLTITNNYGILSFNVDFEKDYKYNYLIYDRNIVCDGEFDKFFEVKEVKYEQIKSFKNATFICVDNIDASIYVRSRKNGDKIEILNVGTKKIKDIFIDKKIQKDLRDKIPIIATDNEVLSIYNINVCKKCLVNENSNKILMIKTKD